MAALQLPHALLGLVFIGISCFMSSAQFFFMSSACLQLKRSQDFELSGLARLLPLSQGQLEQFP